jgi:DNA-binding beta-propeller fold protein YncE
MVMVRGRRGRWLVIMAVAVAVALAARGAFYAVAVVRGPHVIAAGNGPCALAMSRDGRFLYVADYGDGYSAGRTVDVIDVMNGNAAKSIRVGDYPTELAVTPGGRRLYVLVDPVSVTGLGSGELVPVDPVTGAVSQPLRFAGGADEMVLSPDGRTLYVVAGDDNISVVPLDVSDEARGTPITLPDIPNALAMGADGKTLYTAYGDPGDNSSDKIVPVDIASGRQGKQIHVPNEPVGLAVAPRGGVLDVIGNDNDLGVAGPHSLAMVNLAVGKIVSTVSLGLTPTGLTVDPVGRAVFIQGDDNTVEVASQAAGKIEASLHAAGILGNGGPEGDTHSSSCLVVSPDGRTLYAANGDGVAVMPVSSLGFRSHPASVQDKDFNLNERAVVSQSKPIVSVARVIVSMQAKPGGVG